MCQHIGSRSSNVLFEVDCEGGRDILSGDEAENCFPGFNGRSLLLCNVDMWACSMGWRVRTAP
jgi:hypothetical protein